MSRVAPCSINPRCSPLFSREKSPAPPSMSLTPNLSPLPTRSGKPPTSSPPRTPPPSPTPPVPAKALRSREETQAPKPTLIHARERQERRLFRRTQKFPALNRFLISPPALHRLIALSRIHHNLLLLSLLICNHQRPAVRRHQFHLNLPELPILVLIRRSIRDAVLVPQKRRHFPHDPGKFPVKLREPRKSPGHLRKRFQLVFRLQKIHPVHRAQRPMQFQLVAQRLVPPPPPNPPLRPPHTTPR